MSAHQSRASDFVRAVVCGYPRRFWKDRQMLMLQGVFDDSGSSRVEKQFVLAGCITDSSRWMEFSDAWDAMLKASPSINYFKMSEAMSLTGQFEGFPSDVRDLKVYKLAEIVSDYVDAFVASWISWKDFNDFIVCHALGGEASLYWTPYFMLFHKCLGAVNAHARLAIENGNNNVSVGYFFDEQGKDALKALSFWDNMKALLGVENAHLFGNRPIFESEKRFVPLQAADMFAWCVRDYHIKKEDAGSTLLRAAIFKLLARKTGLYLMGYTRDEAMSYGMRLIVVEAAYTGLIVPMN